MNVPSQLLTRQGPADPAAQRILERFGLKKYGLELGNWFGFSGVPMGTGIASFSEILLDNMRVDGRDFSARVIIPNLNVDLQFTSSTRGAIIHTVVEATSNSNGLLGDLVVHSTFHPGEKETAINGIPLNKVGQYVYQKCNQFDLSFGSLGGIRISCGLEKGENLIDLELVPYAVLLADGRIRYHTRALCLGGPNSALLLRSRGVVSCFRVGRAPAFIKRFLYRNERNASTLLRNTQLCAASDFPKGSSIRLWHKLEIL